MINLIPLTDNFTIYQFGDNQEIPLQILDSGFCSVTRTGDEVSVITNCDVKFESFKSSRDWRGFKVKGVLDLSLVGIINEITRPLRENRISVFVVSTFNTDFIFVKNESFSETIEIYKKEENIIIIDT